MPGEVVLYTLGGTIAMAGTASGPDGTVVARLSGADLAASVPGLEELLAEGGTRLRIVDRPRQPSADLTFAQIADLLERAGQAVGFGAGGIVVTQGTDTLEETAFLADLLWSHEEPLVLTGAMRNPTLAGADGPANLLAAVRTAAAPQARGLGVLVAFDDELHPARYVRKTHATSTAAFRSPETGPIGHLEEDRVRILTRPPRREPLPVPPAGAFTATRVALHTFVLDEDDEAALAALTPHVAGLVVAGFGVGHVPGRAARVLGELAARIPVVLTSRTGAETDLQRRGLINGGRLGPYKARILLRTLLAGGADDARVRAAFEEHG